MNVINAFKSNRLEMAWLDNMGSLLKEISVLDERSAEVNSQIPFNPQVTDSVTQNFSHKLWAPLTAYN